MLFSRSEKHQEKYLVKYPEKLCPSNLQSSTKWVLIGGTRSSVLSSITWFFSMDAPIIKLCLNMTKCCQMGDQAELSRWSSSINACAHDQNLLQMPSNASCSKPRGVPDSRFLADTGALSSHSKERISTKIGCTGFVKGVTRLFFVKIQYSISDYRTGSNDTNKQLRKSARKYII